MIPDEIQIEYIVRIQLFRLFCMFQIILNSFKSRINNTDFVTMV